MKSVELDDREIISHCLEVTENEPEVVGLSQIYENPILYGRFCPRDEILGEIKKTTSRVLNTLVRE